MGARIRAREGTILEVVPLLKMRFNSDSAEDRHIKLYNIHTYKQRLAYTGVVRSQILIFILCEKNGLKRRIAQFAACKQIAMTSPEEPRL